MSPILKGDEGELYAALEVLGAGLDDILFSRGTIYLEGDDDKRILSEAFGEQLSRFRLVQMNGRANIEKEIKRIQEGDLKSGITTLHFFIFDLDRKLSDLTDTEHVKVVQLNRRMIENFLLDENAVFDVCSDQDIACTHGPERRGDVLIDLKSAAFEQIAEDALAETYETFNFENPGLRIKDIRNRSHAEATNILADRLLALKQQLVTLDLDNWKQKVQELASERERSTRASWEGGEWKTSCDGKRVLAEIQRKYGLRLGLSQFKRRIVREMKRRKSPLLDDLEKNLAQILSRAADGPLGCLVTPTNGS